MSSDAIQFRQWKNLDFHDPEVVLRNLRNVEVVVAESDLPAKIRNLRTNQLKPHRESRAAAIFTYGISQRFGVKVWLSPFAESDYDFVTMWVQEGVQHFCPVQLKELVASDLNPEATLSSLLSSVGRYSASRRTALAVYLNQRNRFDFSCIKVPVLSFREVWLFGSASLDQSSWLLYGNLLGQPGLSTFSYPWP